MASIFIFVLSFILHYLRASRSIDLVPSVSLGLLPRVRFFHFLRHATSRLHTSSSRPTTASFTCLVAPCPSSCPHFAHARRFIVNIYKPPRTPTSLPFSLQLAPRRCLQRAARVSLVNFYPASQRFASTAALRARLPLPRALFPLTAHCALFRKWRAARSLSFYCCPPLLRFANKHRAVRNERLPSITRARLIIPHSYFLFSLRTRSINLPLRFDVKHLRPRLVEPLGRQVILRLVYTKLHVASTTRLCESYKKNRSVSFRGWFRHSLNYHPHKLTPDLHYLPCYAPSLSSFADIAAARSYFYLPTLLSSRTLSLSSTVCSDHLHCPFPLCSALCRYLCTLRLQFQAQRVSTEAVSILFETFKEQTRSPFLSYDQRLHSLRCYGIPIPS